MVHPADTSDATFDADVLKNDTPVLVDFWAPWCGPCRMVAPIVEELAGEYDGRVKFVKLNTDENPRIASQYGIRSIPTLLVFKGGEVAGQIVGFRPKSDLQKRLDAVLTRQPGGTELGARIRELVLGGEPGDVSARAEALLMAADRAQHADELIVPALRAGRDVVCDRYFPSSVTPPTRNAPDPLVMRDATLRQFPFTRCWTFTGTLAAQALNPSGTLTAPLALLPGRFRETFLA